MAGDWIKMRGNLWDDPRVSKLCDLTNCGEAQVIGGLYWLWATADQHSTDGFMPGLTLRQIDRKAALPGLGEALCSIGWLIETPLGVVLQKFEEHNGTSAKRRCTDAQRKANGRSMSASDADTSPTRDGQGLVEARHPVELEKEKKREKKKEQEPKASTPAPWLVVSDLVADGLSEEVATAWLDHRRAKKAKLTAVAWDGFKAEARKADWAIEAAVLKAIHRGWITVEAAWLTDKLQAASPAHHNRQEALELSNHKVAAAWAAQGETA